MNKKNTIRLTESGLKRIITKSVKKVLQEDYVETPHENKELLPILRERSSELRKMCLEWKKLYKQVYPQWEGEESWYLYILIPKDYGFLTKKSRLFCMDFNYLRGFRCKLVYRSL